MATLNLNNEGGAGSNTKVAEQKTSKVPSPIRTDVILGIQDIYMQQMVSGQKTYEFRKYRLQPSVKRIWFYSIAPLSRIEYICEIEPAVTRNEGDEKLPEDGEGNREYNERHEDWDRYDFAYKILSVWKLLEPVTLGDLKTKFGMGGAPQGMVYTPEPLMENVKWDEQEKLK